MLVSVTVSSDKTTASVATGQNDFHPVYVSVGNLTNKARRSDKGGVALLAYLAIPAGAYCLRACSFLNPRYYLTCFAAKKDEVDTDGFRAFKKHLFHGSLAHILSSLKPGMTKPEVCQCPDRHFRRAIWEIGPYIGDYQEHYLLACIVYGWCAM